MTIIIGLGNPGKRYTNTPHNIGFEIIDKFAKENNFPEFKLSKKSNALVSESNNIILAKPQTFMNESGKSVKKICGGRVSADLIVVHDDIDLPLSKIRISKDRGSAGHKGVKSIIKELGTKNFTRIRIGVESNNVLQKFKKDQRELLKPAILEALENLKK